jgi:ATP-dependent DNA helicase PIF1
MELSIEQQIVFDKYVQGHNIFITGPGGTGKSALIKMIFQHAFNHFKNIQVTALTGCAAVLLNCKAKTLHSWAGIGLGNGSIENLVSKIKKNKFAKDLWKETNILVVDEISMLSLKLFNTLNEIGKVIRHNSRPFGGIQLIFSGDFYQLPPVGDRDEPDTQRFCFESDDWNSVFHRNCQIQLVKIFRQTDETYTTILNQIREGKIKRKSNDIIMQYVGREIDPKLIAEPTKLFPTRNKVENINNSKMSVLNGEEKEYKIKYLKDLEISKSDRERRTEFTDKDIQLELDFLANNLICEKEMKIKIGSQVMCIVNIQNDDNLEICNGSQGIIIGYCEITGCPNVMYNNGIKRVMTPHVWMSDKIPGIGVSQVPLILAWALTIHKSQGASLDAAEIDVGSGIFECGQTYVALSRVKSLDGLYLTSFDVKKIRINKKVRDFYETLTTYQEANSTNEEVYVPLVIAELVSNELIEEKEDIPLAIAKVDQTQVIEEELNEKKINNNIKIIRIN